MVNTDKMHNLVPGDYYHRAINRNVLQKYWHTQRFKVVKEMLKKIKAKEILDIGCHGGRFTSEIHKEFPNALIYGIDISKKAIKYAKKRYPLINFQVSKAEKLKFSRSQFDLITCFEVLEHINNPKKVLSEIKRVVKKNGNLLILIPSENMLFKIMWSIWIKLGPGRVWKHTHVQDFSGNLIDTLLEKCGFKVILKKYFLLNMLVLIQAKKR